jgi:endonuclease-3
VTVAPRRVRAIVRRLERHYGDLLPPRASDPLDELILTVQSQHTSDLNAERAFGLLRGRYPSWDDVVRAPTAELADTIRSGGLANTKAARIQAILRKIHQREGRYDLSGLRPRSDAQIAEYLSSLPGVGPKTVAVVMGFAFGREAIPVDTHVHRVATRLGLVPKTSAERAQRQLEASVPEDLKTPLHVGLIRLGREICKAGRPRCEDCPVFDVCPTGPIVLGRPPRRSQVSPVAQAAPRRRSSARPRPSRKPERHDG